MPSALLYSGMSLKDIVSSLYCLYLAGNSLLNNLCNGSVRSLTDTSPPGSSHTTSHLRLAGTFQGNTSCRRPAQISLETFPLRSSYKTFDELMVDRCPENILYTRLSSAGWCMFLHYTIYMAFLQSCHFLLHQADMLKYERISLLRYMHHFNRI